MDNNQLLIAVVALVVVAITGCVWALLSVRKLKQTIGELAQDNHQLLVTVESQTAEVNNQLAEDRARAVVLGKHLASLENQLTQIEQQIRELKLQDPSLRLYNRATELVKKGASMEEVMQACDIPRAEAELLFSMHRKSS